VIEVNKKTANINVKTAFKMDSYRRQSGTSKMAKIDVSIDFHALLHHYMSVEFCCTVVVKQCMEIYRIIHVLLF